MKLARNILICLAGGLALNAAVRANDVAVPGNPYAPVVARNIFGLNPPPPPAPPAPDTDSLPKITPNGIMSIFGQLQVLFKVTTPAKPGKAEGDDSYILSEGQRQDDIEVVKINEKAGSVTFKNHGTVQELALVAATASSGPAAGGSPGIGFAPPAAGGNESGNHFNGRGGGHYGARNNYNGYGNNGANGGQNPGGQNPGGLNNGGLNFNNPSFGNNVYNAAASQIPDGMTPEAQIPIIEINRQFLQQQGDPTAAILPITELTQPPEGSGN